MDSKCQVCGLTLIKQEIGPDGLPNPKQPDLPEDWSEWKKKEYRKKFPKNFVKIWSCPVHGTHRTL